MTLQLSYSLEVLSSSHSRLIFLLNEKEVKSACQISNITNEMAASPSARSLKLNTVAQTPFALNTDFYGQSMRAECFDHALFFMCLFFMSEMRARELISFGSSVSPQVSPIQANVLAGPLSWLLTSFVSTQKIPVILAPEPFSPSKRKSNSVTEPGGRNKQLRLNKEGQKGKRKIAEAKACFLICTLHFDSSRSHPSEPAPRKIACVWSLLQKAQQSLPLLWNRSLAF